MIRELIVKKMKDKEISVGEISHHAGLPRSSVGRYIHGQRDISGDRASKLMFALGIKVGGKIALDLRNTIRAVVAKHPESLRQQAAFCNVNARVFSHYVEGKRDSATTIIDKMLAGLKIKLG
jgi:plasmid maintenance system antidote protein VapI